MQNCDRVKARSTGEGWKYSRSRYHTPRFTALAGMRSMTQFTQSTKTVYTAKCLLRTAGKKSLAWLY